jgi:hypothetical protein
MSRGKFAPIIRDTTDQFQREAAEIFKGMGKREILQGILLTSLSIGTSTTKVSHGLGRVPLGFIVVDKTANSDIYRDGTVTTERDLFLHLKATTATTISLWVF